MVHDPVPLATPITIMPLTDFYMANKMPMIETTYLYMVNKLPMMTIYLYVDNKMPMLTTIHNYQDDAYHLISIDAYKLTCLIYMYTMETVVVLLW